MMVIVASCNSEATTYTWKYEKSGGFIGVIDTLYEPSINWFETTDYFYPRGFNTAPTASFYGLDSSGTVGFHSVANYASAQPVGDSGCINVQTLTGNLTLTNDSCKYQHLDPNGANRTITLPATADAGKGFVIRNTALYNSGLLLFVGSYNIVANTEEVFVYNGVAWVSEYEYNVNIGKASANNYNVGIGIGYNSQNNYTYGVGIGSDASNNYTYGVGIGAYSSCNGNPYAVALGAKRKAKRRGEVSLLTDESSTSKSNYYIAHYIGETTDDSGDIIFLNAADYCDISANSAVMFKINAICKDATETNMAIWSDGSLGMTGIIYRQGTSAPVINPVAFAYGPDLAIGFVSNPTITIDAGASDNDLLITITGVAGTNLDWQVVVELIEITD